MIDLSSLEGILGTLAGIAEDPAKYASAWKKKTGRKVVGIFPMNFPRELVHAAGGLAVLVQESRAPITMGHSMLFEFYCGYTRSIVDQAMTEEFDVFDGFFLVDHCVALLGAADVIRHQRLDVPIHLAQFTASMDEDTAAPEVTKKMLELRSELEKLCGRTITDDAITDSIRLFNHNRKMQRKIYDLRRVGRIDLTASQIQAIVKSSMIADIEEHNYLLEALVSLANSELQTSKRVKLHLSGHFCYAPRPELLEMIESCGAVIIDDDLFTGYRFISTDVSESEDPISALVQWYFNRNAAVPCSTRAQKNVDWEKYLTRSVEISGAEGVIILMAKFCEPHMLYYPELRKELNRTKTPFLLIETEHEGLALEMLRTRMEALIERIRHPAVREPAVT